MSTQLKVLIVDDELHNRNVLEHMLLQHVPEISGIWQADTVAKAISIIHESRPQIIFLDIHMQNETGFDLLQQITDYPFEVIFVTAYDHYAIKAFRFNAVDYLLKPVVAGELKEAVAKAINRIAGKGHNNLEALSRLHKLAGRNNGSIETLTIPTAEGFVVLQLSEIVYCQANNNYTVFHLAQKQKQIASQTLGFYEELLAEHNFFRAHRSYLVNLTHVTSYKKGEGGYILMSNGDEVELSRNNKAVFLQFFKQ